MAAAWDAGSRPPVGPIGPAGWVRVALKGGAVGGVTFGCLGLLLLVRLVERPLFAPRRPWTPFLTQFVCRAALALIGIRRETHGQPMRHPGAVVANHASWLDIFALNAAQRVVFVAKTEVRGWPGIGWLARATGTVFVRRDRRDALAQRALLRRRLAEGAPVLFFPEGTSTDGLRVLPFKPTLFDALMPDANGGESPESGLWVQPVSVSWFAPEGADPRFYGWWGDMDFAGHLLAVLAAPRQGRVVLRYHTAVAVAGYPDRKGLALALETTVRAGQVLAEGRRA